MVLVDPKALHQGIHAFKRALTVSNYDFLVLAQRESSVCILHSLHELSAVKTGWSLKFPGIYRVGNPMTSVQCTWWAIDWNASEAYPAQTKWRGQNGFKFSVEKATSFGNISRHQTNSKHIPSRAVTSDSASSRRTHQIRFWLRPDCAVILGIEICIEILDDRQLSIVGYLCNAYSRNSGFHHLRKNKRLGTRRYSNHKWLSSAVHCTVCRKYTIYYVYAYVYRNILPGTPRGLYRTSNLYRPVPIHLFAGFLKTCIFEHILETSLAAMMSLWFKLPFWVIWTF